LLYLRVNVFGFPCVVNMFQIYSVVVSTGECRLFFWFSVVFSTLTCFRCFRFILLLYLRVNVFGFPCVVNMFQIYSVVVSNG
jgi:hypothetical protein